MSFLMSAKHAPAPSRRLGAGACFDASRGRQRATRETDTRVVGRRAPKARAAASASREAAAAPQASPLPHREHELEHRGATLTLVRSWIHDVDDSGAAPLPRAVLGEFLAVCGRNFAHGFLSTPSVRLHHQLVAARERLGARGDGLLASARRASGTPPDAMVEPPSMPSAGRRRSCPRGSPSAPHRSRAV